MLGDLGVLVVECRIRGSKRENPNGAREHVGEWRVQRGSATGRVTALGSLVAEGKDQFREAAGTFGGQTKSDVRS
jgi:hypothetical protein